MTPLCQLEESQVPDAWQWDQPTLMGRDQAHLQRPVWDFRGWLLSGLVSRLCLLLAAGCCGSASCFLICQIQIETGPTSVVGLLGGQMTSEAREVDSAAHGLPALPHSPEPSSQAHSRPGLGKPCQREHRQRRGEMKTSRLCAQSSLGSPVLQGNKLPSQAEPPGASCPVRLCILSFPFLSLSCQMLLPPKKEYCSSFTSSGSFCFLLTPWSSLFCMEPGKSLTH